MPPHDADDSKGLLQNPDEDENMSLGEEMWFVQGRQHWHITPQVASITLI